MNEIVGNRWTQAHEELKVALRLPAAEASLRANELVHQALQQTLRTDAEAVQTLSDWNITLDRLEDAASRRGYQVSQFNLINAMKTDTYNPLDMAAGDDRDEREELEEDRLKADSMGEASLIAMQTDAAQIARMVRVATSSPKVRLDREVAEELARLNLRTVDEEHPEGIVASALGLTREELARRYAPESVVREPAVMVPGRATSTRSMTMTGRVAPVRASGIDFSREGATGEPAPQPPTPSRRIAAPERPSRVVVPEPERDREIAAAADTAARSRRDPQPAPRVTAPIPGLPSGAAAEAASTADRGPEY